MDEEPKPEVNAMRNSNRLVFSLLLALVLALLCAPALAEDVYVVEDASAVSRVSTERSYLRVRCALDGAQPVTMTISDSWGYLYYQRDYGMCVGAFRSEDVYLRLDGSSTVYNVTLQAGDSAYQFRVTREQPRLTDTAVCAHGLALDRINEDVRGQKYAVIIDPYALEGSTLSVPLVSAGMQVGYASFTVDHGRLTVSAMLTADGEIDKATVYVAHDAVTARTLGSNRCTGVKTRLNREIELYGTPYAAVLVQLTASYDAATAQELTLDEKYLELQEEMWELMQLTTANEVLG